MIEKMKTCTGCKKMLTLSEFNDAPTGKHFKKSRCKQCEARYYKNYYTHRKKQYQSFKEQQLKLNPSLS